MKERVLEKGERERVKARLEWELPEREGLIRESALPGLATAAGREQLCQTCPVSLPRMVRCGFRIVTLL